MMRNATMIVIGVVTLCTIYGLSNASIRSSAARNSQDYLDAEDQLWLRTTAATQRRIEIAVDGMETGSAGFYLLRPNNDPSLTYDLANSRDGMTAAFDFEVIQSRHADYPYRTIPGGASIAMASVSLDRVLGNENIKAVQKVSTSVDGPFAVDVMFGDDALAALSELTAPKSDPNLDYVDWFVVARPAGDSPSECRIVLVSNGEAHLAFSALDFVELDQRGQWIRVAYRLSSQEADDLVSGLSN